MPICKFEMKHSKLNTPRAYVGEPTCLKSFALRDDESVSKINSDVLFLFTDAKAVASSYDCKYTETSGALNHNVDELLVGILKQIRLKSLGMQSKSLRNAAAGGKKHLMRLGLSVPDAKNPVARRKSAGVRVRGLLGKMLRGDSKSKSCDDLHVL